MSNGGIKTGGKHIKVKEKAGKRIKWRAHLAIEGRDWKEIDRKGSIIAEKTGTGQAEKGRNRGKKLSAE
jgi:hypothetical protein